MALTMQRVSFQEFTALPLREIVKPDGSAMAIEVTTPQGIEILDYKVTHNPFIGSITQTDKLAQEIIAKLQQLERESRDFLFRQWTKSIVVHP